MKGQASSTDLIGLANCRTFTECCRRYFDRLLTKPRQTVDILLTKRGQIRYVDFTVNGGEEGIRTLGG